MIGNREDALAALDGDARVYSRMGSTRIVYLIYGVIYKIDNGDLGFSDNLAEYENILAYKDNLPEGVYFPDTALYEFGSERVIAMEYIQGQIMADCNCLAGIEECTDSCMPHSIKAKVKGIIDDTGGENVIVKDNGDIYIIDVGC